jgi:hypothetical protein
MYEILLKRIETIEKRVDEAFALKSEYEEILILANDPKEIRKIYLELQRLDKLVKGWIEEWLQIKQQIKQIQTELDGIINSLEETGN